MASLSTATGSPASSASRGRSGKSRQPGMLSGETSSPPAVIGPPQPTPTATGRSPEAAVERGGHERGDARPRVVAIGRPFAPRQDLAVVIHQTDGQLGPADVDGEVGPHAAEL